MSKFWAVVTILFMTAIILLAVERQENPSEITFSDLETECRYDTDNSTSIGLEHNRITFSGRFIAANPDTNLDYSYSISDSNSINLDIITRDSVVPNRFAGNCLGSVIYDAKTQPLEEGNYTVTVHHDGDRQERVGIRVK